MYNILLPYNTTKEFTNMFRNAFWSNFPEPVVANPSNSDTQEDNTRIFSSTTPEVANCPVTKSGRVRWKKALHISGDKKL